MNITLKNLYVSRQEYGVDKGHLHGKVEFKGPYGSVEIQLDEDLANQVVELCADGIVRAAQQVANHLTADMLTADPEQVLIEHG